MKSVHNSSKLLCCIKLYLKRRANMRVHKSKRTPQYVNSCYNVYVQNLYRMALCSPAHHVCTAIVAMSMKV